MKFIVITLLLIILTSIKAMAGWNIGIMCVKADSVKTDTVIPDIFVKTQTDMWFEDATSSRMGSSLGVGYFNGWIIIINVNGRIISDQKYPIETSNDFEVKTFWIAEQLIYRKYYNGLLQKEIKGIEAGGKYLQSQNIAPKDEWGETRIIQIFELEIMNDTNNSWVEKLFELKFDKYEIE